MLLVASLYLVECQQAWASAGKRRIRSLLLPTVRAERLTRCAQKEAPGKRRGGISAQAIRLQGRLELNDALSNLPMKVQCSLKCDLWLDAIKQTLLLISLSNPILRLVIPSQSSPCCYALLSSLYGRQS